VYNYITLAAVKRYIGGGIDTSDDALLLEFIEWAARLVESWKGRRFDPRLESRVYDTPHPVSYTHLLLERARKYNERISS